MPIADHKLMSIVGQLPPVGVGGRGTRVCAPGLFFTVQVQGQVQVQIQVQISILKLTNLYEYNKV